MLFELELFPVSETIRLTTEAVECGFSGKRNNPTRSQTCVWREIYDKGLVPGNRIFRERPHDAETKVQLKVSVRKPDVPRATT